jgi:hypothetical protein
MTGARQAEIPYEQTDPGKRDGGLRSIALIPHSGTRFSSIVSMRAGEGRGRSIQGAARLKGKRIEVREGAETRTSFNGEDFLCDDLF